MVRIHVGQTSLPSSVPKIVQAKSTMHRGNLSTLNVFFMACGCLNGLRNG